MLNDGAHPHECSELQGLLQNGKFKKETMQDFLAKIHPLIESYVEDVLGGYSTQSVQKTTEILGIIEKSLQELTRK